MKMLRTIATKTKTTHLKKVMLMNHVIARRQMMKIVNSTVKQFVVVKLFVVVKPLEVVKLFVVVSLIANY